MMHTAVSLSDEFGNWLSSLEGGGYVPPSLTPTKTKKREAQNRRTMMMARQILQECFGEKTFELASLVQLKTVGRSCGQAASVIERLKGNKTWGTVKNYLSSLSHFLNFLEACYSDKISIDIAGIRTTVYGITRSVNKFVAEELQRRKLKTQDLLIPEDTVAAYCCKNIANKLILEAKKKHSSEITKFEKERLRNHLALRTSFLNAKRSGILCDLKCSQVQNPKREQVYNPQNQLNQDVYVVLVEDGKTFRSTGAAGIQFTKTEHEELMYYIDNVRPASTSDQVFCTTDGAQSTSSNINIYLQKAFNDFGIATKITVPHITSTIIRKTMITLAREKNRSRDEQMSMAQHMDHSVETADRNYDVSSGVKNTAKFRTIIQSLITGWEDVIDQPEADEDKEDEPEADEDNGDNDGDENAGDDTPHEHLPANNSLLTCSIKFKFGKPEVFTPEDRERVRRACSRLIADKMKNGGPVKCAEVVKCVQEAGITFQDLFSLYTKKQLYSRVRTEIRKARLSTISC